MASFLVGLLVGGAGASRLCTLACSGYTTPRSVGCLLLTGQARIVRYSGQMGFAGRLRCASLGAAHYNLALAGNAPQNPRWPGVARCL